MATLDDVDADTAWQIADHVCRHCFSRVLVRTTGDGRTIAKCSGCELEAIGGPEAVCWCGSLPPNFKTALRCMRNPQPTAETPDAVLVVEATGDADTGPVDVKYFEIEGVGKRFFRCDAYRSTLSTEACATNFQRAQRTTAEEWTHMARCRGCRIGANHANETYIARSALYELGVCPRCRRGGARMIGRRLCVSCFNRNREFRIGRSCKGRPPRFRFDPRGLAAIIDYGGPAQRRFELRDEFTRDTLELAVQVLSTVPGRIAFCRPRAGAAMTTTELAEELAPKRPKRGIGATINRARRPRKIKPVDLRSNEQRDEPQQNEQREAVASICVAGAQA